MYLRAKEAAAAAGRSTLWRILLRVADGTAGRESAVGLLHVSGRHWDSALRLRFLRKVHAWDWISYSITNFDVFICVIKIL